MMRNSCLVKKRKFRRNTKRLRINMVTIALVPLLAAAGFQTVQINRLMTDTRELGKSIAEISLDRKLILIEYVQAEPSGSSRSDVVFPL